MGIGRAPIQPCLRPVSVLYTRAGPFFLVRGPPLPTIKVYLGNLLSQRATSKIYLKEYPRLLPRPVGVFSPGTYLRYLPKVCREGMISLTRIFVSGAVPRDGGDMSSAATLMPPKPSKP